MKSSELLLTVVGIVLSLGHPSVSRFLPGWSGGNEGGLGVQEVDPDLSPKDLSSYWQPTSYPSQSWFLPTSSRERRAENYIRFGRSHADKTQANKKNFIRLGRENPNKTNFIRLGRGGGDESNGVLGSGWKWPTGDGLGVSLRENLHDSSNTDYGGTGLN